MRIEFDWSFFAGTALIFVPLITFRVIAWRAKSARTRRFATVGIFVWIAIWAYIFWKLPILR